MPHCNGESGGAGGTFLPFPVDSLAFSGSLQEMKFLVCGVA